MQVCASQAVPPGLHRFADACTDGNAAKSQLTKANQTKTKMENLARELQKVGAATPLLSLYRE